jgi:hypothetical protein
MALFSGIHGFEAAVFGRAHAGIQNGGHAEIAGAFDTDDRLLGIDFELLDGVLLRWEYWRRQIAARRARPSPAKPCEKDVPLPGTAQERY